MPSIRQGKPILSPNVKPCEAVRKPINYSYDEAFTCKGENTLNKVGKVKYILLQWQALSNGWEANEMFHYGDTHTYEGITSPQHGRKVNTFSKVSPTK